MIKMPMVAPTPQLKQRWSVGAECGNKQLLFKKTFQGGWMNGRVFGWLEIACDQIHSLNSLENIFSISYNMP